MAIVHSGKNAFCGLGSYHHFHLLSNSICESVRAFKYTVSAIANLGEQSVDERPQPSHNLSFVLNKSTIQTTTTTNNALHTSASNFAPRTRTQVPAPSTPLNADQEERVPYSRNETMPPITCARQTLSAICIPTQPKLPHDVQDVLLQTREDEGSLGVATRDAVRYDPVCFSVQRFTSPRLNPLRANRTESRVSLRSVAVLLMPASLVYSGR